MSSTSPTNVPVKACNFCRNSHTACDGERPCRRCVKRGLSDQCCDLAPRKKGRPARTDPRFRPKYPNGSNNNAPNKVHHDGTTTTTSTSSSPTNVPVTASDSRRCSTTSDSDTPTTGQSWYTNNLPSSENEYDLEGARPGSNHSSSTTTTRYPFEHVDDAPYAVSEDDSSEEEDEAGERGMASSEADLASKVIAMMADETHKLRKEVAKLRAKVKKLRKYKRLYEEQVCSSAPSSSYISSGQHTYGSNKRPRHDPASEGPVSPPSFVPMDPIRKAPSTDGASLPADASGAECPSLVEARKHMAFLQHYRLPPDVPFVVGDMHSRPVFALEVPGMGQAISFAYANEAFANMLQFSTDELRRTPPGAVLSENVRLRDRMVRCLLNREPMAASEIFAMCPLMRRKDGRTLRGTCNMQFLFDSTGAVKHIICVTLHCEEDTRREHERFLEKVGSNALVVPASHTAAPQHPQQHHQPQHQLFNSTCAESAAVPPRSNAGGFDSPPPTAYAQGGHAYWDWVLGQPQPQPLAAGPTLGAANLWRA